MNALEKAVDVIIALVLLFFIPLLYYKGGENVSKAILAGQACETFLKRISTAGEISRPVWEEFERSLRRCDCFEYELRRARILFEPAAEAGGVVERTYIKEKEELFEQVVTEGKSRLQNGDRLWLTIYANQVPAVYFASVRAGEEYS